MSFQLPPLNQKAILGVVDSNLGVVLSAVFNPNLYMRQPKLSRCGNRYLPIYTKFYEDLSSEGLSIVTSPFETLFVCLSKIDWNQKLKHRKTTQVQGLIKSISGQEVAQSADIGQLRNQFDLVDLEDIKKHYLKLLSLIEHK